jgi:polar amino acid transport system substrate-binding protein
MKIKTLIVVTFAALTVVFTAGCQKKAAPASAKETVAPAAIRTLQPGVLQVGMEIGYPPLEYKDKDGVTPIGFDVDLGNALAAKLGIKAQYIDTSFDGIFAGLDTNRYDVIISGVTMSPERIAKYAFCRPYIANNLAVVVLANSALKVNSPDDLVGHGVGYQAETTSDFFLANYAKAHNVKFTTFEYDQVLQAFDELKLGRIDAVLTDKLVATDYIKDPTYKIIWEGKDQGEFFGLCVKKDNIALHDALNKALGDLFTDGTMVNLSKKWFSGQDLVTSAQNAKMPEPAPAK